MGVAHVEEGADFFDRMDERHDIGQHRVIQRFVATMVFMHGGQG